MSDELKPCPFCQASMASSMPDAWWVVCDNNVCCAESPVKNAEAAAMAAWNIRK